MTATASSPGSSANLGPGFDAVAIAWELRCHVSAEPHDRWEVHQYGRTSEPSPGDLVSRIIAATGSRPLSLTIDNEVPRARGLGSSAAFAAATIAAVMRVDRGESDRDEVFRIVAELEGHPDNAAAAVFGGAVLAGEAHHVQLVVHPSLRFLVGIPGQPLATSSARAALPAHLSRDAVARSVRRVGMLLEGLRTADAAALGLAGGDEIHELHRGVLSPLTTELISTATAAGALHACWSGAGPTALALCTDDSVEAVQAAWHPLLRDEGSIRELEMATTGLA